jgi:uncharacterized protein Smg (DUF494 family)
MEHLRHRLRDLLLLLLDSLGEDGDQSDTGRDELRALLTGAGLATEDLHDLLAWLSTAASDEELSDEAWLTARRYARASAGALRQMGQREDELLTVPAFDYLLRLVRTGQISAEQMESLIQFAQLAPGGPLSPGELTPLLDRVVFADRRDEMSLGPERTH